MNREQETRRMQKVLQRLGIPLQVTWVPNAECGRHGEIQNDYLMIYEGSQGDAWATFIHEILEYKMKKIVGVYRMIINSLISALEKTVYEEKERFVEGIPKLFQAVEDEKDC